MHCYKCTKDNPNDKKEIPSFLFPVVFKKFDISGEASSTNMPHAGGDAKTFVS
jgi:hypothetical protein